MSISNCTHDPVSVVGLATIIGGSTALVSAYVAVNLTMPLVGISLTTALMGLAFLHSLGKDVDNVTVDGNERGSVEDTVQTPSKMSTFKYCCVMTAVGAFRVVGFIYPRQVAIFDIVTISAFSICCVAVALQQICIRASKEAGEASAKGEEVRQNPTFRAPFEDNPVVCIARGLWKVMQCCFSGLCIVFWLADIWVRVEEEARHQRRVNQVVQNGFGYLYSCVAPSNRRSE